MKKLLAAMAITLFLCKTAYAEEALPPATPAITDESVPSTHNDRQLKKIIFSSTPDEIRQLLSQKIDLNKNYGCTSILNTAILSFIASSVPPEDTFEKVSLIINAGANVNLEICKMTPLAVAVSLPSQAKELEKRYIEAQNNEIYTSAGNCYINGITKPCSEITIGEKLQMNEEIHQSFSERLKAAEPYFIAVIDLLLQNGADINQKSYGAPPIHMAVHTIKNGNSEILKHLISKGADLHIKDSLGDTPLSMAQLTDNKEAEEILLKALAEEEALDTAENEIQEGTPAAP